MSYKKPLYLILVGTMLSGCTDSSQFIANKLYKDKPAPWELVDAFYYPNKNNLARHVEYKGFNSLESCRWWARLQAQNYKDPTFTNSTYECGVGYIGDKYQGLNVYRLTVQ